LHNYLKKEVILMSDKKNDCFCGCAGQQIQPSVPKVKKEEKQEAKKK